MLGDSKRNHGSQLLIWDITCDVTFIPKEWEALHSTATLRFHCDEVSQWISLLSQSPCLVSPKLQPYSFQSQCQHSCPGDHCDTSTTYVPSFKHLATSKSLGFSLCTVVSVKLPCFGLFPQVTWKPTLYSFFYL